MAFVWLIYAMLGLIFAVSLRRPIGARVEARRQHANLRRELRALGTGPSDMPFSGPAAIRRRSSPALSSNCTRWSPRSSASRRR